jgi:hypothetical protein
MTPIRGRHHLTRAATATLQTHLPATLRQAASDGDFVLDENHHLPKTWRRPTAKEIIEPLLPVIITTSTGIVEQPEVDGDGDVSATFDLVVNAIVRGDSFDQTADLISLYAAAIAACLEQHRTLGVDWVSDLNWVDLVWGDEDPDQRRLLAEALVVFHVNVAPVHNRHDRPTDDPDDPLLVETTNVTVDTLEEE